MEKLPGFIEPVTPKFSYDWNVEDSGYHTSYTPGSFECSETTDETLQSISRRSKRKAWHYYVDDSNRTPEYILKNVQSSYNKTLEGCKESPLKRRGIKRSHTEERENTDNGFSSILTPTSNISGELHRLRFSDSKKYSTSFTSTNIEYSNSSDAKSDSCLSDSHYYATIPTTPIKKMCRNDCKLNSPERQRKLGRNLNLVIHSLSCDRKALQFKVKSVESKQKSFHQYNVKPHQKIDIIKMLHQRANALPPLMKIFSYLNHEDIFNFTLVSQDWLQVWDDVSETKRQGEYLKYLNEIRESQENRMSTPKLREMHISRPLMEIQNICGKNVSVNPPLSPTKSPGTIRFKRFTKTASIDLRKQLPCVKCQLPAKITEEISGEQWGECTSLFCSFQFCFFCKYARHTGTKCFEFDYDGPSPSKRTCKKDICVAGTKKSRKNLRRLLT